MNPVSEDELRAALRPYRTDPSAFEAAVRERIRVGGQQRENDPLATLSPLKRKVAALLPVQFTGSEIVATSAVPAGTGYALLGYLAFPAICLFVLFGVTLLSLAKIRSIQGANKSGLDEETMRQGITEWWRRHTWGAILVFAGTICMSLLGASWLLFLLYIVSLALQLYVLTSLAKLGLGSRVLVGQSYATGLIFLAQTSMFPAVGDNDIHLVDPLLVSAVFWGGVLALLPLSAGGYHLTDWRKEKIPRWFFGVLAAGAAPFLVWWVVSILTPVTPAEIKRYVESFDEAPYSTASWHQWEIPARWTVESKLDPDLSKPRRLLAQHLAGEQNPFILGTAVRVGLIKVDQLGQLRDYAKQRQLLFGGPRHIAEKQQLTSVQQLDWVIRAAAMRSDISPAERDYLEKRLNLTMESLSQSPYEVLETALRVTELLEVIDRPIDRDRYRDQVHDWLRRSHATRGGGFQLAGGFKKYLNSPVAALDSTSDAVQLMAIYGIPDDLDVDWVRSYLRTRWFRAGPEKWMAPVTLDRFTRLPGVTRPSWFRILYYERSLLAALVLVALCIYATVSSPASSPKAKTV